MSKLGTKIVCDANEEKAAAEDELTDIFIVLVTVPSRIISSTEFNITVCGTFQLEGEKTLGVVNRFTTTSLKSKLVISRMTSPESGSASKTKVKLTVAEEPS